jgi:flagellar protein FlbD
MIALTRLNGQRFVLNAELIKIVESTPDTTIRLTNGESYIVQETAEEVVDLAIEYGRLLRSLVIRA